MPKPPRTESYTLAQITDAVVPILAALSGGSVDRADAMAIAALLGPAVNSPVAGIAPGQNLALSSEFIRLVAEKKGAAQFGSDQEQARRQMLDALKNANVSSSAFAAALNNAGLGGAALWVRGAQTADARSNGGRYDGIKGTDTGYSWLTAANQNIPGFTTAQIGASANFLKGMGLSRAEVNENIRDMVHLSKYKDEIADLYRRKKDIERRRARGEDVSDDENKLDEDKKKIRAHMTPDEQRHFDNLKLIQLRNRENAEHDLKAARNESLERRSARNDHRMDVALTQSKEANVKESKKATVAEVKSSVDDVFGTAAPTSRQSAAAQPPNKSVGDDPPKPPLKVASARSASAPAPGG